VISICIPIFNYDVSTLIESLKLAVTKALVPVEIVIYEDGSESVNSEFSNGEFKLLTIRQFQSKTNKGRAYSRNFLAEKASYPNLVFLDCDGFILNENFIIHYLAYLPLKERVISGGRNYQSLKPEDPELYLHWLYGTQVESKPSSQRNLQPYLLFHSNNFMVSKELLLERPFDEELSRYGYEDSVWAKILKEKGISIVHIDNEVVHLGLEKNDIFLEKTNQALRNLVFLRKNKKSAGIKLESFYHEHFLAKMGLVKMGIKLFNFTIPWLVSNLKSTHPKLWIFSLYKLFSYSKYWEEGFDLPKKIP